MESNFIRGNSKSNRAKSSKMSNHLGLGTLKQMFERGVVAAMLVI